MMVLNGTPSTEMSLTLTITWPTFEVQRVVRHWQPENDTRQGKAEAEKGNTKGVEVMVTEQRMMEQLEVP